MTEIRVAGVIFDARALNELAAAILEFAAAIRAAESATWGACFRLDPASSWWER